MTTMGQPNQEAFFPKSGPSDLQQKWQMVNIECHFVCAHEQQTFHPDTIAVQPIRDHFVCAHEQQTFHPDTFAVQPKRDQIWDCWGVHC